MTGAIGLDHPTWGNIDLATYRYDLTIRGGGIVAVDGQGEMVWERALDEASRYRLGFEGRGDGWPFEAQPPSGLQPRDGTGNIFINYDPGRYNGVIVLRPTDDGDGVYEIRSEINTCEPSCADGNTLVRLHRWNGQDFVLDESGCPAAAQGAEALAAAVIDDFNAEAWSSIEGCASSGGLSAFAGTLLDDPRRVRHLLPERPVRPHRVLHRGSGRLRLRHPDRAGPAGRGRGRSGGRRDVNGGRPA